MRMFMALNKAGRRIRVCKSCLDEARLTGREIKVLWEIQSNVITRCRLCYYKEGEIK